MNATEQALAAAEVEVVAKATRRRFTVELDVFSRYVVGWMIAHRESATLAETFT